MKITIDLLKLKRALESRNLSFLRAVRSNWAQASLNFISLIQKTQMSGRPGLRRISGLLVNSWHQETKVVKAKDVEARIYTSVRYARVHEYGTPSQEIPAIMIPARQQVLTMQTKRTRYGLFGMKAGGNRFVRPRIDKATGHLKKNQRQKMVDIRAHQIKIPQRLHVREAWRRDGLRMATEGLAEAMKQFEGSNK